MKAFYLALVALGGVSIAAASACSTSVSCDPGVDCGSGGLGGAGGASTTTTNSSSTTPTGGNGGGPIALSAIVYGTDPLKLRVATYPLSCTAPDKPAPYSQCGWEDSTITFPAALLDAGTFSLSDSGVQVYEGTEDFPSSSNAHDCGGSAAVSGGGTGTTGTTVVVQSSDASSVTFTLSNVDNVGSPGMPAFDGTYTAARCQ